MPGRTLFPTLTLGMVLSLAAVAARPLLGQAISQRQSIGASLGAADLSELVKRCGGVEPLEETLELVQKHACSRRRAEAGRMLAFEENKWFVYALADMTQAAGAEDDNQPRQNARRLRRLLLLKPSTLVVEDLVSAAEQKQPIRWVLRSPSEPKIEAARFRVSEANAEIVGDTLLPPDATLKKAARPARDGRPAGFRVEIVPKQAADVVRFLHVFQLVESGEQAGPAKPQVTSNVESIELTVAGQDKLFRLILPTLGTAAAKIEIKGKDGASLVASRLLPSGVMPHGPKGAELLERWDAPYRREGMPGWDVGRPCTHLVKGVEGKEFSPGRAIVFGCGTGTNAIYLAGKGFEVTGVDVSPSALAIAAQKAQKAGVKVEWMLADVVALPKLPPVDLVFDRGCYHHICQYDSPGYVETLRRLSHAGTRALVLAGSPADGNRGGPPRIPEETIRKDFSELFAFEWLRDIHFDSRNPETKGPSAWSIHLRRKEQ